MFTWMSEDDMRREMLSQKEDDDAKGVSFSAKSHPSFISTENMHNGFLYSSMCIACSLGWSNNLGKKMEYNNYNMSQHNRIFLEWKMMMMMMMMIICLFIVFMIVSNNNNILVFNATANATLWVDDINSPFLKLFSNGMCFIL